MKMIKKGRQYNNCGKNFRTKQHFLVEKIQKEKEESIKAVEKMHAILKNVSDRCFTEILSKINLK